MAAILSLVLGAAALLGGGWFASSLVASLADPVSLLLAGLAGVSLFVNMVRNDLASEFFSSENGELLGAGLAGASTSVFVFAVSQSLITTLSPLAGIIVVGLGVAVFFLGPGVLFDLLSVLADFVGGD